MAVKLYIQDDLKAISGLYVDKALARMNSDFDVYSTLLDKFLNQLPRSIPRLRQALKDGKADVYAAELKDLRVDLADIYALSMLSRANVMYEAAESGDLNKCRTQLEPFIQTVQAFAYEVKQCRTQDDIENPEEAASKAAELDIGMTVVNNKYSTVNKAKFIDLYKRLDMGLHDKALNLANVIKALGYDSELTSVVQQIVSDLNNNRVRSAKELSRRLLVILNIPVPEHEAPKFNLLIVDNSGLEIDGAAPEEYNVMRVKTLQEVITAIKSSYPPDFILINSTSSGEDPYLVAQKVKLSGAGTPMGFIFMAPTSEEVIKARNNGVTEFFIMPFDSRSFLEKLAKYKHT